MNIRLPFSPLTLVSTLLILSSCASKKESNEANIQRPNVIYVLAVNVGDIYWLTIRKYVFSCFCFREKILQLSYD